MKWCIPHVSAILLAIASSAHALDTASLLNDSAEMELLQKNCIRAETSGVVPIRFDTACEILTQPDLYQMLQDEYARSVSKNGKVDFPIIETKPGHYYYVNADNQRTDIVELYRQQTEAGVFDVVLKASGKRFFGHYDVIIHVQILDAVDAGVTYFADVNAYPYNGAMRFIARRLGMVERYFKKNTDDILWVARKIGTGLSDRIGFDPANVQEKQATASFSLQTALDHWNET